MCVLSRPSLVFSRPLSRVCAPAPTVLRVFVLSILVGGAPCFGRVLARYQCWTRHRVCLLYARSVTCASVKTLAYAT